MASFEHHDPSCAKTSQIQTARLTLHPGLEIFRVEFPFPPSKGFKMKIAASVGLVNRGKGSQVHLKYIPVGRRVWTPWTRQEENILSSFGAFSTDAVFVINYSTQDNECDRLLGSTPIKTFLQRSGRLFLGHSPPQFILIIFTVCTYMVRLLLPFVSRSMPLCYIIINIEYRSRIFFGVWPALAALDGS